MFRGASGPKLSSSQTAEEAVSSRISCEIISDVVDVKTKRSWPAATAASSRLSVPVTLASIKAVLGWRAISGLWSAAAWITASMLWLEKARSTTALSATEPTTWVSAPGAMSRPIVTWPAAWSRGARNRPSHPEEPVSRTRIRKSLSSPGGMPECVPFECLPFTSAEHRLPRGGARRPGAHRGRLARRPRRRAGALVRLLAGRAVGNGGGHHLPRAGRLHAVMRAQRLVAARLILPCVVVEIAEGGRQAVAHLVARIGRYRRGVDGISGTPFLTADHHRAIQSEPRSPASHPEAAGRSHEFGCLSYSLLLDHTLDRGL